MRGGWGVFRGAVDGWVNEEGRGKKEEGEADD
jgi:hypothetical protein